MRCDCCNSEFQSAPSIAQFDLIPEIHSAGAFSAYIPVKTRSQLCANCNPLVWDWLVTQGFSRIPVAGSAYKNACRVVASKPRPHSPPIVIPPPVREIDMPLDSSLCAICADALPGKTVGILNCDHIFHFACIEKWRRTKPLCPLCRQPITSLTSASIREI